MKSNTTECVTNGHMEMENNDRLKRKTLDHCHYSNMLSYAFVQFIISWIEVKILFQSTFIVFVHMNLSYFLTPSAKILRLGYLQSFYFHIYKYLDFWHKKDLNLRIHWKFDLEV